MNNRRTNHLVRKPKVKRIVAAIRPDQYYGHESILGVNDSVGQNLSYSDPRKVLSTNRPQKYLKNVKKLRTLQTDMNDDEGFKSDWMDSLKEIVDEYEDEKFSFRKETHPGFQCEDEDSPPSIGKAIQLDQELKYLHSRLVALGRQINNVNPSQIQRFQGGFSDPFGSGSDSIKSVSGRKFSGTNSTTPSEPSETESSQFSKLSGLSKDLCDVDDLVNISGALTEDSIIRSIQSRFTNGIYYVNMGHILVTINPFQQHKLESTKTIISPIEKLVKDVYRQHFETYNPQVIILSGSSGSGKTYNSKLLMRQLFALSENTEKCIFKHLEAFLTVLTAFGTASIRENPESSRIGHFIEVQMLQGVINRTRIHCYFLDQSRVVKNLIGGSNYHIFYQFLAGLNSEEREKLFVGDHSMESLKYLGSHHNLQDLKLNESKFLDWKNSLAILGIAFLDVAKILASILLLGNVEFVQVHPCSEVLIVGSEIKSISALLGVSEHSLKQSLTTRTHNSNNQLIKSGCDFNKCHQNKDTLAKALYCRTIATIVRRANNIKSATSEACTDSDSVPAESNQSCSTPGTSPSLRQLTDSFMGILDMFGFEDEKSNHLEQLCVNLSAEMIQHFYNKSVFKASFESYHESIQSDWELDYVDNALCIDLISSQRTGLLNMLDQECLQTEGTVQNYLAKVHVQHQKNPRLLTYDPKYFNSFAIQHYAGRVRYDVTGFMGVNRDVLPDDLVAIFHKHRCNFGFASHLFGPELKILGAGGVDPCPKGIKFRISLNYSEAKESSESITTLTQDFNFRLDSLLKTLNHSRPHFIRCIKINNTQQPDLFERQTVSKQLRAFQILETVNFMVNGFPHRMRLKQFRIRYKSLTRFNQFSKCDEQIINDCRTILDCLAKDGQMKWAVGKKHVFMSERSLQKMEALRNERMSTAACLIQATWHGWRSRRILSEKKTEKVYESTHQLIVKEDQTLIGTTGLPEMSPIPPMSYGFPSSTSSPGACVNYPIPFNNRSEDTICQKVSIEDSVLQIQNLKSECLPPPKFQEAEPSQVKPQVLNLKLVQKTCQLFGLDMDRPPPLPPSRPYTIRGIRKFGFPQIRMMRLSFPGEGSAEVILFKGQLVKVIGVSGHRGHFIVDNKNQVIHVPFQFLNKLGE